MRKAAHLTGVFALLAVIFASNAFCSEIQIANSYLPEENPAVAYNRMTREYLVVFVKPPKYVLGDTKPKNTEIHAQRITDEGQKRGSPIKVFAGYHHGNKTPWISLIYNKYMGRYLLAWGWTPWEDPFSTKIYTQELSISGKPEGRPKVIDAQSIGAMTPEIEWNSVEYHSVLIWAARYNGVHNIFSVKLTWGGNKDPWHNANVVSPPHTGTRWNPRVTFNSKQNEYLVAWLDQDNGNCEIYGRRLDSDGLPIQGDFWIGTFTDSCPDRYGPQTLDVSITVTYNSAVDEYLVAWERDGNIYGRLVRDHTPIGDIFQIAPWARFPDAAYSADKNKYIIVYHHPYYQYDNDIHATIFSSVYPRGIKEIKRLTIYDRDYWYKNEFKPRLAFNHDADDFLVVWHHKKAPDNLDTHGRRVSGAGQLDKDIVTHDWGNPSGFY